MMVWVRKGVRRLGAEVREWRRWDALRHADDIRVYYGMDRLPERTDPISGGIVKCLDLADAFPNHVTRPNLLYLVSSALPARRELLARAVDTQRGRQTGSMSFTNNVTNTADARRAIGTWSTALTQGLNELYNRAN